MNALRPFLATEMAALADVLPDGGLLTDEEDLARYSVDWSGDHTGRPLAVARPRSTAEVSALLRCCSEFGIRVVPQGGLTEEQQAADGDDLCGQQQRERWQPSDPRRGQQQRGRCRRRRDGRRIW